MMAFMNAGGWVVGWLIFVWVCFGGCRCGCGGGGGRVGVGGEGIMWSHSTHIRKCDTFDRLSVLPLPVLSSCQRVRECSLPLLQGTALTLCRQKQSSLGSRRWRPAHTTGAAWAAAHGGSSYLLSKKRVKPYVPPSVSRGQGQGLVACPKHPVI